MNILQEEFISAISNEKADEMMVESVSQAMLIKLCKKRNEGRGGWHRLHEIKNENFINMLKDHIDKGDMVDVLNFAAMIHVRTELYGEDAQESKRQPKPRLNDYNNRRE